MRQPQAKIYLLLRWIHDYLLGKFNIKTVRGEIELSKQAISIELAFLARVGLLIREEPAYKRVFYSKSPSWDLKKATDLTYKRLQRKAQVEQERKLKKRREVEGRVE